MKLKLLISLLAMSGIFLWFQSSQAQTPTVSHIKIVNVAEALVDYLEARPSLSLLELISVLKLYQTRLEDESWKVAVMEQLIREVYDAYYEVNDFLACERYYDGCNECEVLPNGLLRCTERACIRHDTPRCLEYADDPSSDEALCEAEAGTRNETRDECTGIDEERCEDIWGSREDCGSACRHDPDAEVCTLQCVQFCQL